MVDGGAPDLDALRAALRSPVPLDNLAAIEAAAKMREAAAPLVPDLLQFLTSEAHVPCTSREYEFSGHALLAEEARGAIEMIGVAPGFDALRRLLADHRVFLMPKASYDQGAYIGDYDSETLAPAAQAARLVALFGQGGFAFLPDLEANARCEADEIGQPSRRAIGEMSKLYRDASEGDRQAFAAAIDRIANLPDVLAPTTHRGFDLRDLARACKREIEKG